MMALCRAVSILISSFYNFIETTCFSFAHVHRVGNFVAHNLAKHARYVSDYLIWMEGVPPHIYSVLIGDRG